MTIYAAWYIYRQMHKARVVVWRQRRYVSSLSLSLLSICLSLSCLPFSFCRNISSLIQWSVADNARMTAKEKGLSSDPVMAEIGGSKGYTEQELEEVRSPILQDPDHQRHQSYQNPYDIRSALSLAPIHPIQPASKWAQADYLVGINQETTCHSTTLKDRS